MNQIETSLKALADYYGANLDEMGFDAEDEETFIRIYRDEDGWHVSTPYAQVELTDEEWAPKSDAHAEEIAAAIAE